MQIDSIFPQIVAADFKPHWIEGLDEKQYHADKTAISSSGIRARTPAHFFENYISGTPTESTPAQRFGILAHKALNEPEAFRNSYQVMPDFGNCTYKDNKANRDG